MSVNFEKVFLSLDNEKEIKGFLKDLLSPKEYESLKERWRIAELLNKGHPYREISELTGASTATITRVARCFTSDKSGYKKALEKIN